jgi:hypothetical protein
MQIRRILTRSPLPLAETAAVIVAVIWMLFASG